MKSFAAGVLASLLLSGLTLWAMTAGTVTMVERTETMSTLTDSGLWHEFGTDTGMQAPVDPDN